MTLTIAAILAAARTPRASTPCATCGAGSSIAVACARAAADLAYSKARVDRALSDAEASRAAREAGDAAFAKNGGRCSCAGREAVKVLCAGLTDEELRAEIERCERPEAWTNGIRDRKPAWGQGWTAAELRDYTNAAPVLSGEVARYITHDEGRVYLYAADADDHVFTWSDRCWLRAMRRAAAIRGAQAGETLCRRDARLARAALENERDRRLLPP